jgi:hypothetical protein
MARRRDRPTGIAAAGDDQELSAGINSNVTVTGAASAVRSERSWEQLDYNGASALPANSPLAQSLSREGWYKGDPVPVLPR